MRGGADDCGRSLKCDAAWQGQAVPCRPLEQAPAAQQNSAPPGQGRQVPPTKPLPRAHSRQRVRLQDPQLGKRSSHCRGWPLSHAKEGVIWTAGASAHQWFETHPRMPGACPPRHSHLASSGCTPRRPATRRTRSQVRLADR